MQANIGELDIRLTRQTLVMGNLALLQVQALIVSFVAGLVAFLLGLLSRIGISSSVNADGRSGYFECIMVRVCSTNAMLQLVIVHAGPLRQYARG